MYIQICPLRLALLGVRLSRHRVGSRSYTYQFSYSLAVHNRRLQASQLDRRVANVFCAARVRSPRTSVDYRPVARIRITPVTLLGGARKSRIGGQPLWRIVLISSVSHRLCHPSIRVPAITEICHSAPGTI